MGAGVAGLQAIATARRIGAVVSATDVRAVAKEEVESLGATFVVVESENDDSGQTEGGYAKEMSDDYKRRQAELIATHISGQDIVITTALIPGRTAPVLINDEMIASMKAGSVILDLAVEQGGNVTRSVGDKIITTENGVVIMGHFNLPSRLASDASALYARNLYNFVELMIDKETQQLEIDWDDEIISSSCLTRDGKIIHPALLEEKKELDLSDPGSVKPQQEGV
jgi:NAD(P) transhydrogenase subunit alpha